MNDRQSHLLRLLKEIDSFCSSHDITYYCAAGTVLGAVRHGGFIPWDDDIDILMTRSEFNRFTDAFRKHGPQDRTIEFYEGDHEHHSPVARYVQEGTCMFAHYHITGYAAAGILIDIFVLDPLPDGQKARDEYLAKFFAYCDLITPTLSYSNRLPEEYSHLIYEYEDKISEESRDAVISKLSDEIFSYEEKDCSRYMLRWGSTPFTYPIEFFGAPHYMDFEDMSIPVPSHWPEYLAVHYGSGWTDIPYVDAQTQHTSVFGADTDYHEIYRLRDGMFTQEDMYRLHQEMKLARRESDRLTRQMEEYAASMRTKMCRLEIEDKLSASGYGSASDLFDHQQYSLLAEIYRPYIELQTDPYFMGSAKHGAIYHWLFPVIVPVEADELSCILWSLIYDRRLSAAEKLLGIYERAGLFSDALMPVRQLISGIIVAAGHYYTDEYEDALQMIRSVPDHESIPALMDLYWLASVRKGLSRDEALKLKAIAESENSSFEQRKAYADWLWMNAHNDEAVSIYSSIMRSCRNGMFMKDILGKGLDIGEIPLGRKAVHADSDVSLRILSLIGEITDICNEEGIPYILGDKLAQNISLHNTVGFDENEYEILMPAASAARFIEAFDRRGITERRLLSWSEGDNVPGFILRYTAEDSTDVDLRTLSTRTAQDRNLGITIRILRSASSGPIYSKVSRMEEILIRMMDSESASGVKPGSGLRRLAVNTMRSMSEDAKISRRKKQFRRSMRTASASSDSGYYYYSYGKGLSPVRHSVPASALMNTESLEFRGRSFAVSESAIRNAAAVDHQGLSAPKKSLFRLQSPIIAQERLFSDADIEICRSLPWAEYNKAIKKTSSYDKEVKAVWDKVRESALRLCD